MDIDLINKSSSEIATILLKQLEGINYYKIVAILDEMKVGAMMVCINTPQKA